MGGSNIWFARLEGQFSSEWQNFFCKRLIIFHTIRKWGTIWQTLIMLHLNPPLSLARHLWKEMLFTISMKLCFFLLFWPAEKGTPFKFQRHFTKKIGKLIFKPYFLLHVICYIAPQWFIWTTRNLCFRIYFYIAPKRSQKITILF